MKWGKHMKRIISLLVAMATAFSMGVFASASTIIAEEYSEKIVNPPGMELFWVNVASIDLGLTYSGNVVTCSGTIRGNANVNSISATFTLSRQNANGTFTAVKTWSRSSNTRTL